MVPRPRLRGMAYRSLCVRRPIWPGDRLPIGLCRHSSAGDLCLSRCRCLRCMSTQQGAAQLVMRHRLATNPSSYWDVRPCLVLRQRRLARLGEKGSKAGPGLGSSSSAGSLWSREVCSTGFHGPFAPDPTSRVGSLWLADAGLAFSLVGRSLSGVRVAEFLGIAGVRCPISP